MNKKLKSKILVNGALACAAATIGSTGLTTSAPAAETSARARQVLILYSFGREFAPFDIMTGAFRNELAERSPVPIEFHEAVLETARYQGPENEQPLVHYLQALFAKRPPDLIVTLGGPAGLFMNRHPELLMPDVPMIVTVEQRRVKELGISTNIAVVPGRLNLPGFVEDILQVLPATTNIVVVLGATPFERYWTGQFRRAFAGFTNRVTFTYFNDLSLDSMVKRVATLPPDSAILYGTLVTDAAGVTHEKETALKELRASANAPVFGLFEQQLGLGIVGGRLASNKAWGRRAAETALRILNAEPPNQIKPQLTGPGAPVYDWRELQRWGIGLDRLPPGAVIRFREPTPWERNKWTVLGGMTLILIEAGLIGGLVLQLRRRLRAEALARGSERAARELSGRLINAQEEERSRIARDLHDDLNQRLSLLSVEMDSLGQAGSKTNSATRLSELANHVRDLSSDVHKLAYQLHPAKLNQLGLVAAAASLCRELSQQSGLKIDFVHQDVPRELPEEVALCAFRVIQESLTNVIRHSGAKAATVELTVQAGRLQVRVKDAGKGFAVGPARQTDGLGLLSMRERARLLEGNLEVRSIPGRGTQVEFSLRLYNEEYSV